MNHFRDIANLAIWLLPTSGFFALKRFLLKLSGIDIGFDTKINGHTWFYGRGNIVIGDRTWIGPGCRFYSTHGTTIHVGSDCDVAPQVAFVTGSHEFGTATRRAGHGYAQDIIVGNGTWLGARVTLLGGVTVGAGSFVAAGALVNSEVPPNSLVAGMPAKVKRTFSN